MLLLDRGNINIFGILWRSKGRGESGEFEVVVVKTIDQQASGHDVARGQVGLKLCEIAQPPYGVRIFSRQQLGNDDVVVFAIEPVKEPYSSFFDRTRNGETRINFVERPAFLVLE